MPYHRSYLFLFLTVLCLLLPGCAEKDQVITFGLDEKMGESTAGTVSKTPDSSDPLHSLEGNDPNGQAEGDSTECSEMILVYVCGAVNSPGVVSLPAGSRIIDALELAGGFAEDADEIHLNLAATVTDGQQLYFPYVGDENIPSRGTEGMPGESYHEDADVTSEGRVNINTDDPDLLCSIPGIGQVKAEEIIRYRKDNGDFTDIRDITKVSGIGEALYEKIKDHIFIK